MKWINYGSPDPIKSGQTDTYYPLFLKCHDKEIEIFENNNLGESKKLSYELADYLAISIKESINQPMPIQGLDEQPIRLKLLVAITIFMIIFGFIVNVIIKF